MASVIGQIGDRLNNPAAADETVAETAAAWQLALKVQAPARD
jgi:hypothetical protein